MILVGKGEILARPGAAFSPIFPVEARLESRPALVGYRLGLLVALAVVAGCGSSPERSHSLAATKACLEARGYNPAAEGPPTLRALTTTVEAGAAVIMYFWPNADEAAYRVEHGDVPTGLDHERHGNVVVVWAGYVPSRLKERFRDCVT